MFVSSAIMCVIFGAISAYMARGRGKNPYLWFFLGMFFGLFGVLFLAFGSRFKKRAKKPLEPTIDITPQFDPVHQNKFWYFLSPENKQNGPMSFDALTQAYREGKKMEGISLIP